MRTGPMIIKKKKKKRKIMLNSDEHEIFYASKYKNAKKSWQFGIY